jgi:hypothetical protein
VSEVKYSHMEQVCPLRLKPAHSLASKGVFERKIESTHHPDLWMILRGDHGEQFRGAIGRNGWGTAHHGGLVHKLLEGSQGGGGVARTPQQVGPHIRMDTLRTPYTKKGDALGRQLQGDVVHSAVRVAGQKDGPGSGKQSLNCCGQGAALAGSRHALH